ncbi:MAG: 50S ribosomal protein P1 [Candidatus Aenigmatarchaeota archaeon]|nr:50S ribosomal protein P1 [Candidatus Aenigmarchaeota archaeon]
MEMIYTALLLHATKQPINEENVSKVLAAAGAQADPAKIKALVSSLEGLNIDETIAKAAMPVAVAAAPAAAPAEKKEEKKEEEVTKKAEEAAAGLGALFG